LFRGVDSVTGSRWGGFWHTDAELMNTYCQVLPAHSSTSDSM
jgi:hypothetical protein